MSYCDAPALSVWTGWEDYIPDGKDHCERCGGLHFDSAAELTDFVGGGDWIGRLSKMLGEE